MKHYEYLEEQNEYLRKQLRRTTLHVQLGNSPEAS